MSPSSFFSFLKSKSPHDGKHPLTFKERFFALRNLPKLFRLIWETSKPMTIASLLLRLVRAAVPVVTLYIGKLIINEIVRLIAMKGERDFSQLWLFVGAEFVVILLSDLLGRLTALIDSLLGDKFSNETSLRLMRHAADLDLYHFEDSTFYDKLERARQQTIGRTALMSQSFAQMQDLISMAFLAVGLIAFNPWLIILLFVALVPAFLGEAHFNARTYSFMRKWTPERRELDMLRYTGASDETAKEVKIFGLSSFLTGRYKKLSDEFYRINRSLSVRRATWGSALKMLGTAGYYAAYVLIIVRTVSGSITLGDLTFLAGSFNRLQSLMEGVLTRFTQMAEGALYLNDLFDFFALTPRVQSPAKSRPFPRPIKQGFTFEDVGFIYPNSER